MHVRSIADHFTAGRQAPLSFLTVQFDHVRIPDTIMVVYLRMLYYAFEVLNPAAVRLTLQANRIYKCRYLYPTCNILAAS